MQIAATCTLPLLKAKNKTKNKNKKTNKLKNNQNLPFKQCEAMRYNAIFLNCIFYFCIFFCILKMCFYNHATKNLAVFFLRK